MSNTPFKVGRSAKIRLWMELDGHIHDLDQVAAEWIIPTTFCDSPPAQAVIVMEIDGRQHRRRVTLPEGISPNRGSFVPIRDDMAGSDQRALAV